MHTTYILAYTNTSHISLKFILCTQYNPLLPHLYLEYFDGNAAILDGETTPRYNGKDNPFNKCTFEYKQRGLHSIYVLSHAD